VVELREKSGGLHRAQGLMETFKETMDFCNLNDLDAKGPLFTWTNGREGEKFIQERLDRGIANISWCSLFPDFGIFVEATTSSDHALLLLKLNEKKRRRWNKGAFRYEAKWGLNKQCKKVIKKVWRRKNP
jgi:hypothetical protein